MEWALVGAMGGAWGITFGLFLLLMKKEYRSTFFTARPGKEFITNSFLKNKDDEMKCVIMKKNKKMWRPIRGDVKEWVQANWWRWEEEKPEWMTESWIAKVPLDVIPVEARQSVKAIRASARRRSSFAVIAKEEDIRTVQPLS